MKHKSNAKNEQEQVINTHYKAAAKTLINNLESPYDFLDFLSEALKWIYNFDTREMGKVDKEDVSHMALTWMITDISIPWLKGGPDVLENVAAGIEAYHDTFSHDNMHAILSMVTQSMGLYLNDIIASDNSIHKYHKTIVTLYEVVNHMGNIEAEKLNSKAA